jgi:hypothetical protein
MLSIKVLNETNKIAHNLNAKRLNVEAMIADEDGSFLFTFPNTFPTCQNKESTMFMLNVVSTTKSINCLVRESVVSVPFVALSRLTDYKKKPPTDVWEEFSTITSSTKYDDFMANKCIQAVAQPFGNNRKNDRYVTQYFVESVGKKGIGKTFTLYTYVRSSFNQTVNITQQSPDFSYCTNGSRVDAQSKDPNKADLGLIDQLIHEHESLSLISQSAQQRLNETISALVRELVENKSVDLLDRLV